MTSSAASRSEGSRTRGAGPTRRRRCNVVDAGVAVGPRPTCAQNAVVTKPIMLAQQSLRFAASFWETGQELALDAERADVLP